MLEDGDDLDIQGPLENKGGRAAAGEEGDVMVVKKGPWSAEEDERLKKCVEEHGIGNWITIEKYSGLGRTSKSCRLRWTNHLRPNLKKGSFTKQEERLVVKLHKKYGNKWSYISSKVPPIVVLFWCILCCNLWYLIRCISGFRPKINLPGRTDNEIKNFWHGRSSPTAVTQSSAPAQGSSISAKGSSAPSPKIDVSSSVTSSQFSSTATGSLINSPKLHLSVQLPTASSVPLQTSSLPSALSSSNLNSPKIHDPMIASPHSPLRLNLTSSIPLDSHLQHNRCASPFLLSSQSWNASKAEPPSVQTPTSALRPTPEMKDSERSVAVLDAPLQEAQAKADTLHKNSPEELSVDGYLINNDLQGKILVTESIRDNVFYQSSSERDFSCEKPRTINLLGQSLKQENTTRETPKTEDLINKRSCKKVSHDKCLKPGILMGKISRRQGLLSEISKTGVLLVESEKKQILLQELMNNNLTQDVLARRSSKTVDLQLGGLTKTTKLFGERLSIEDPLSQISARKSSVVQKSEEGVSIFENLTSLRNQNLVEDILDISPTRSASNPDTFGFSYSPKDTTTQFISDDLQWNLSSAQVVAGEVCNEILRGGAPLASQLQEHQIETLGPVFSHRPELVLSNFGYDGGGKSTCGEFYEGDHLDKSSREKCPDSPKGEFIEDQSQGGQVVSGGFMTEGMLVSQNWHEILRGSISDLDQYITANLLRSPTPDGKLNTPQECGGGIMEEALSIEGLSSRSLKNGVSLDQSSRDIFVGESSSANVIGLHEVALSEFVSPPRQTTVAHLLTSRDQFSEAGSSQCYEGE
ncbi:unnamed protein product [Coffea canephora]|uniref:Uncharacterized protein n=1 Tax=Coffea canephora TaxID=49390 RepID=A0A068UBW2_COFCA|nr:unnamed protein product [Coffea canephora]